MRRRAAGRSGRPGLLGTAARTAVIAGTATAVSGKVAASQGAAARVPAPPPSAGPAPAPATDPGPLLSDEVFDQLRKLGELRDAGILTEDEFTAKKTQLLS